MDSTSQKSHHRSWGLVAALTGFLQLLVPGSLLAGNDIWTTSGPLGGQVNALVVDPVEHNIVYAGVEFVGVLKSTDGGKSWNPATSSQPCAQVFSLVMDPSERKTIYAACGGLLKRYH
jgi:hypothetical protein